MLHPGNVWLVYERDKPPLCTCFNAHCPYFRLQTTYPRGGTVVYTFEQELGIIGSYSVQIIVSMILQIRAGFCLRFSGESREIRQSDRHSGKIPLSTKFHMKGICRQELLFTNSVPTYVGLVNTDSGHVTYHNQ